MQNLFQYLIDEQDDQENDIHLEILNDIHGHLDIDQICKYHDLLSYQKISSECTNYFNILHINARSLSGKIDQIEAFLTPLSNPPDVLCITESWLQTDSHEYCNIRGYKAYHVFRKQREHGGVSIFIADHLNSDQLKDLSYIHDEIELNTVDVYVRNKSYSVCAIYRPHSKHERVDQFSEKLSQILMSNSLRGKETILLGDFNINLLEIDQHIPTNNYLAQVQSLNYFTHICRPTRNPDGNQTGDPSLLDHIYTNFHNNFKTGILLDDISDHFPTFINIPLPPLQNPNENTYSNTIKKSFRSFSQANHVKFTNRLSNTDWDELLRADDINLITQRFYDHVLATYNESFPLITKDISLKRIENPWVTIGILKSIKMKNKLFKDMKLGLTTLGYYKHYRNHLNNIIRSSKRDYFLNYFERYKNNIRKIWQKINEFKETPKSKRQQKILIDNTLTTDDNSIADAFNKFYTNIGPSLDSKIPHPARDPLSYLRGNYPHSFAVPIVSTDETVNMIRSLKDKNDKAIPTSLIKSNSQLFAIPLTLIFNKSIQEGVFPQIFKHASVIPLYKKGAKTEIENYRPISLLPTFSKIFECLMKHHLVNYLVSKSILSEYQFGFQKGLSTFDALNALTSDLYSALDKHKSAICIFIDFQKAFDTVNHELLIKKMNHYGIRGSVLNWFVSYLSNRTQSVSYNNASSLPLPVTHGVPQGSILGPILFLVYINDMSNSFSKLKVILFADDSSLYLIGSDLIAMVHQANTELDSFYEWVLCNRLSIHLDKTKYLILTNKKYDFVPPLFINFDLIQRTECHKALGVILDDKLSFKSHIQSVCQKLSRSVSLFYNLKNYAPLSVLLTIYYAHVHPHLSYCLALFGSTYPTHLQSLFIIQKKIIRLVTKQPALSHTNDLFKQTKILKLFDMIKLEIAVFMYKNINSGMFQTLLHNYNTRFRQNLVAPNHELAIFEKCLAYNGPHLWNTIPDQIKLKPSINSFKRSYKSLLLANY